MNILLLEFSRLSLVILSKYRNSHETILHIYYFQTVSFLILIIQLLLFYNSNYYIINIIILLILYNYI